MADDVVTADTFTCEKIMAVGVTLNVAAAIGLLLNPDLAAIALRVTVVFMVRGEPYRADFVVGSFPSVV